MQGARIPEQGLLFRELDPTSVHSLSCVWLCDHMDCSTPGFPVPHQLPELTQTHVHWVGDAIQPSHPLSSPSPPAFNLSQHQDLFQWVSSSHQVAKVLSTCRVISCVVGRGCLLWSVHPLVKTVRLALLHIVLQGQTCLLLQVSLNFLLLVWVLEGLVGLHRTVQFQFLLHYWLGHRLGLLWYWMVCLGNE